MAMYKATINPEMAVYTVWDEEAEPDASLEMYISLPDNVLAQTNLHHPELRVQYDEQSDEPQSSAILTSAEIYKDSRSIRLPIPENRVAFAALSKSDNGIYTEPMSEDWLRKVRLGYVEALGWLLLQADSVCVVFTPFGRPKGGTSELQVHSSRPIQADESSAQKIKKRIDHITGPIARYVTENATAASRLEGYYPGSRANTSIFDGIYNKS